MHGTSVTSLFQALSQATTRLISTVRTVIELDTEKNNYALEILFDDGKKVFLITQLVIPKNNNL